MRTGDKEPLPFRDKLTIAFLGFFALIAFTFEAYWLLHHDSMEGDRSFLARALALYWPADRTYRIPGHSVEKSFTLALESVNVCITQWLSAWLVYAIVRRRSYRHVLQLIISVYTLYGTFLYFYVAHLSGYAVFDPRGTYAFVMFYAINAPWFLGFAWFAFDSARAIVRALRPHEAPTPAALPRPSQPSRPAFVS